MKSKIISMALSFSMVFSLFSSPLSAKAETLETEATGTTYYVSTLDGHDSNDGLSESKAFYSLEKINDIELQPGDRVLLESGSVFTNGFLHIKGSGSEGAPIEIDKYGEGSNPRIDTNGQGVWYQDYGKQLDSASHKYKDYVSSSILLYDVEYIHIRNLEITNKALDIDLKYNSLNTMNRTGVAAVAQNKGTIDHIYLDGLNIHDVIGNVYDKHMNNGGIYFTVFKPTNEAETGIARYNDIKIENNIVNNVNRWGIAVGYTAYWDKFLGATIPDETIAKYGSTGVEIRNNYIKDAGGDAITTMYVDRPIVEYNVSDGAARQINTTDYSETSSGRVAAAIWPWKTKDAIFQYNEAFDTVYNQDAQAWDADYGDGTIYQYNYSHNNAGGAVMFCGIQAVNSVFRYNISENDLAGVLNIPGNPDAKIYNNTFYMKEGVPFIRPGMAGGTAVLENNIIYNSGAIKQEDWTRENSKVTYSNNLYYNYSNLPSSDTAAITADPKFVNPGNGPTEYTGKAPSSGEKITHDLSAFDGYKLSADSPAINKGKIIDDNGGFDFFGNEVSGIPDIGAYESATADIGLNDNSIKDAVYMINEGNKTIYIPNLDNNKATVKEVIEGISVHSTATIKIFNGENEVKDGTIAEGMTLKVIAENNDENVYSINVKNNYQWALDYTGTQGNVWFAQKKASGVYSNLDIYDTTYPQWNGNNYAGVGLDLQNKTTAPTETTNGLLVDTMGTVREQGHSMAYRVPKSGTIVLSVKDNEPYLRQAGNSGGKVKLSFTHNGNEISSYELNQSLTKINVEPMKIIVEKGDFIRVEALNIDNPTKPSIHITPTISYQNIDEIKPTAPTEIKASNIKGTSADINWTASSDNVKVTGYEVYNGDNLLVTVNDKTSANITGLTLGTEYTLSVKAFDAAGNKSDAGTVTFRTRENNEELPSINDIEDSVYMINESSKTIYIPSVDTNKTSINEVLEGISIDSTATIKIFNGNSEVKEGNIAEGMTLKVIAANDDENVYSINVKNNYQWALDYTGSQGNVWFAQKKASGLYSDLTIYDATYPQWNGNNYAGVGLDLANKTTAPTETTHGLLVDTMGTVREQGHSIAYRVPKSGTIVLSVKDNEPYLRQAGNSGGKVKLSFTHNGTEISSYELAQSSVKANVAPMTISVKKGDFIRVEALNIDNPTKPSIHITPAISYQNIDGEKPTAPTEVNAINITETSADISWTASSDNVNVTGYEIYNGENLLLTVNNEVSANIIGLLPGTEYTLSVKAVDAAGNRSEAGTVTFRTDEAAVEVDEEEPTVPTEVIASNITENSVDISWTPSSDNVKVTGYEVYNGENLLAKVNDKTSVNISGLLPGTEYNLSVKAVDAAGNKSEAGTVTFRTNEAAIEVDEEAPTVPTAVIASNITETSADISWTASSDNVEVTGYEVYNGQNLLLTVNNEVSANIIGLLPGTEYTLSVKAVDEAGNKSEDGTVTFRTNEEAVEVDEEAPTAPTEVKASNVTETSAEISWTASSDNVKVTGYEVYNGEKLLAKVNDKTSVNITGLLPGTEYTLSVKAIDAAGNKSEAGTIKFTLSSNNEEKPTVPEVPGNPGVPITPEVPVTPETPIIEEEPKTPVVKEEPKKEIKPIKLNVKKDKVVFTENKVKGSSLPNTGGNSPILPTTLSVITLLLGAVLLKKKR